MTPKQIADLQITAGCRRKAKLTSCSALWIIGDFVCSRCEFEIRSVSTYEWIKVYELVYMRQIRRCAGHRISDDIRAVRLQKTTGRAATSKDGRMRSSRFLVDDSGAIYMSWTNPYDVTEVLTENSVMLGLMRIMEKDNPDTGLLIPVWDFFGDVTVEHTDDSGQKRTDISTDSYQSLLTINAIDGSIIDREIGF